MFCNGPKTDEGDIARLVSTTITRMMILKVLFVLDHDSGRYRWFGRVHQLLFFFNYYKLLVKLLTNCTCGGKKEIMKANVMEFSPKICKIIYLSM